MAGGWTIPTLKEHFDAILAERKEARTSALVAQQKALDAALASAEKAVSEAKTTTEERLKLLNELRAGVATKEQLDSANERINDLKARLDRMEGRSSGLASGWGYIVGAVGLAAVVVGLFMALR